MGFEAELVVDLEHGGVAVGVAGAYEPHVGALAQHAVEHGGLEPAAKAVAAELREHAGVALPQVLWAVRVVVHLAEAGEGACGALARIYRPANGALGGHGLLPLPQVLGGG